MAHEKFSPIDARCSYRRRQRCVDLRQLARICMFASALEEPVRANKISEVKFGTMGYNGTTVLRYEPRPSFAEPHGSDYYVVV